MTQIYSRGQTGKIEKRLAILEPKQELLDKYEVLQSLYEQYKAANDANGTRSRGRRMKLITYDWKKVERAVQDIAMGMYKDC